MQGAQWPCAPEVLPVAPCINRNPVDGQVVLRATKLVLLSMLYGCHAEATQCADQGDEKGATNKGPVCSECIKHTHMQPAHAGPCKHHLAGEILDTHQGSILTTHTQCTSFTIPSEGELVNCDAACHRGTSPSVSNLLQTVLLTHQWYCCSLQCTPIKLSYYTW